MTRSSTPRAGLPIRIGPVGRWLAPVLSIAGLLIIALVTLDLLQGGVPFVGGGKASGNGNVSGNATPAPANVIVVPPDVVAVPGSIVYVKAGNIWVQSGKDARQLTTGGGDSMPSWSPDGSSIYFIRTVQSVGRWPSAGITRDYELFTPSIMRIKADGSGTAAVVVTGKVVRNGLTWHAWIRDPVLSPDGRTLAMVSDRPDPTQSDVVVQFYDIDSKTSTIPKLTEEAPLGHQDPAWRADGKALLYVRNARDGSRGASAIWRWDLAKAKASAVTGPGYLDPSFSPDGRYIAATKTSSFGNDLVILDASTGRELTRVTNDGSSWAPVWSPVGDSIAFLHIQGQIVDLKLVRLSGDAPNWTVKDVISLTEVSGLDGESRPAWFVPASELPTPTATPVPTAPPSSGPSSAP